MNKAFILALITSFIWGLSPALEKLGLAGKLDPTTGVVLRSVPLAVVAIVGLAMLWKTGGVAEIDTKSALLVMAGGLLAGFVGQLFYYSALKTGDVSVVVPVAATFPLVALVISVAFLGEAFTWQKLSGILFVVTGVVLLK